MRKHLRGWVILMALAVGLAGAVQAQAMVVAMSIGDLTGKASDVVVGRVSAVQAKWTSDKSLIVTQAVVEVDQSLKGSLSKESILVETLGGELDDIGLRVSGMPTFSANEQVVLFLRSAEAKASVASGIKMLLSQAGGDIATYGVVGGAQGKYLLQGGMASKGGFVTASGVASAVNLSQDDLITLIKEAVADAGGK